MMIGFLISLLISLALANEANDDPLCRFTPPDMYGVYHLTPEELKANVHCCSALCPKPQGHVLHFNDGIKILMFVWAFVTCYRYLLAMMELNNWLRRR